MRHMSGLRHTMSKSALTLVFMVCTLAIGCRQQINRVSVLAYRPGPEKTEVFYQDFSQAWFVRSGRGEYQLLLENIEPIQSESSSHHMLRQSLYCRILWEPVPGKTFAESSQINARVEYRLDVAPPQEVAVTSQQPKTSLDYRGSGFVSFSLDRSGEIMRGTIEQAVLELEGSSSNHSEKDKEMGRMVLKEGKFVARKAADQIAEYKIVHGKM